MEVVIQELILLFIQVSGIKKPPDAVSSSAVMNRAAIQSWTFAEIMRLSLPTNMFLLSFGSTEKFRIKAVH